MTEASKVAGLSLDPFNSKGRKHRRRIVTSIVEDYLDEHDGLVLDDEKAARLAALVTTPPRDRSGSFSGSARGTCERAQVFQFLGVPKGGRGIDTKLQSVFLDGTWRHLRWQMLLLAAGERYSIPVEVEVPFRNEDLRLRGSVDGIVDGHGFELKGTRAFQSARSKPFAAHVLQVHSYMVLTGLDTFSIVYEDKATQDTSEHIIERNPKTEAKVRGELERLNAAIDTEALPAVQRGCSAEVKSQEWWDCPYRAVCDQHDYASAAEAGRG